jgi:hypothetical protein
VIRIPRMQACPLRFPGSTLILSRYVMALIFEAQLSVCRTAKLVKENS